jgi:hypothetical protein
VEKLKARKRAMGKQGLLFQKVLEGSDFNSSFNGGKPLRTVVGSKLPSYFQACCIVK